MGIIKATHIIVMVTWFAGLFYIPRLFVYQIEAETMKMMKSRQKQAAVVSGSSTLKNLLQVAHDVAPNSSSKKTNYFTAAKCTPTHKSNSHRNHGVSANKDNFEE